MVRACNIYGNRRTEQKVLVLRSEGINYIEDLLLNWILKRKEERLFSIFILSRMQSSCGLVSPEY